jgi:hypothetical protein
LGYRRDGGSVDCKDYETDDTRSSHSALLQSPTYYQTGRAKVMDNRYRASFYSREPVVFVALVGHGEPWLTPSQ